MSDCVFCRIIAREEPASIVYEDERVLGIVPLHSIYPQSCVLMPKVHVDHFDDLPEELAAYLMRIAHRIAKKLREVYQPERVGLLVHGYGVAHAHINIFPQHGPHDVTSCKFAYLEEGKVQFGLKNVVVPTREEMDAIAEALRIA